MRRGIGQNHAMQLPTFESFYGVDFSGGRLAGRNVWVARCEPASGGRKPAVASTAGFCPPLALVALDCLEALAGTADRAPALAHLVQLVRSSSAALWGFDFPFGLPVELFPAGHTWPRAFDFLNRYADDAYRCGLECVRRARKLKHAEAHRTKHHVRRVTDVEARAPFDTFHYRMRSRCRNASVVSPSRSVVHLSPHFSRRIPVDDPSTDALLESPSRPER